MSEDRRGDRAAGERPTGSTRQQAVMELIRTADEVRRYFAAFYEPYGITAQQYNVLRILRGAHPAALPTMEIADRMLEKTPGITRLLDRLEDKDLIRRERPPHDRRRVLISISAQGLELLDTLEAPVYEATTAVLAALEGHEVEGLKSTLVRIRRTL